MDHRGPVDNLSVTVAFHENTPVIHVAGEIDLSNTNVIEQAVADSVTNEAFAAVLDLTDVTYMDSAGIRMLYNLSALLHVHLQRCIITVPREAQINRTLEAAGALTTLLLSRSVEESLAIANDNDRPS